MVIFFYLSRTFLNPQNFLPFARSGGSSSPVAANGCRRDRSSRGGFIEGDQVPLDDRRSCVLVDVTHAEPGQAGNGAALRVYRVYPGSRRGGTPGTHPLSSVLHPRARIFSLLDIYAGSGNSSSASRASRACISRIVSTPSNLPGKWRVAFSQNFLYENSCSWTAATMRPVS